MSRIIRLREDDLFAELDALDDDRDSSYPAEVVQTLEQETYPTTPGAFYACNPVTVTGDVAEGTVPDLTADVSVTLYAFNLGSTVPPVGSYALASACGGRLVFRWDS
jgi:hypothetical protein